MRKQRMFIDFHVLQTVPPSCVNRDDTGSPKTAVYGGVTRARVSSQAWKHAMREYFMNEAIEDNIGQRTKRVVGMVQEKIEKLGDVKDSEKLAIKVLGGAIPDFKSTEGKTDALFFMSHKQAKNLAKLAVEQPELLKNKKDKKDKEKCQAALKEDPSMDMVLFGRMVANDPSLNYDAASQVAHSISTHAVQNEYDYFTAVDDRQREDESGAAHLDTTEYNSSTLYRYANINVTELQKHLPGDAAAVVRMFAKAFVRSMPEGKQNSFANRTLPADVYVVVRGDQPVNLAPAFEKPVSAGRGNGFLEGSEKALAAYASKVYAQGMADAPLLALCVGDMAEALGAEKVTLDQLLDRIEGWVREHGQDGGAA